MKKLLYLLVIPFSWTMAMAQVPGEASKDGSAISDTLSSGKKEAMIIVHDSMKLKPEPVLSRQNRLTPDIGRPQRKSIKKAFFLSLLVPGSGEFYVGQKGYARGFIAAEGMIWSFALISQFQGRMWKEDYIGYAAQKAGANPDRQDDRYYKDIYEWPNSYWYNEYQWVLARDLYPDDPGAQAAYVADKLYSSADAWEWTTMEEWNRFRSLRVKSESAYRRVTYAAGAALLNHLLSAVNAARLAKGYNKREARKFSWDMNLYPSPDGGLTFIFDGRF